MKNVFKKLSSLLLLTSVAVSLFSCHGKLDPTANDTEANATNYSETLLGYKLPESFDETKQYEISFWAKSDSNATQTAIYQKAIADFEKLYPNVKVNLLVEMDYGRIYQKVITNIQTKTTPNVCISYPDHVATYLTGDSVVVPLDNLMTDERYGLGGSELKFDGPKRDEMIEKFLDECKINGSYYLMPYMRSTEACYINKTYVEALGYEIPEVLTWDFIWEVSEAAMAKNEDGTFKVNGQKVLIPFIYKSTDNMMIQMLEQKGADYSTETGDIEIFHDTTKEFLLEIAAHAESGAFSTFKISSYPGNYLNRGQCLFAIDSSAGATWMGSNAPLMDIHSTEAVDFETVVKPIPQFDTENPKMISQGPSVCLFYKEDPGEVLASWLFLQYLLTNDIQIPYAETEGYVPVTEKAQGAPEYLDYLSRSGEDNQLYYDIKIDATKLLLENTDNTFVTPVFNGSASLRNAAGQMIEEVVKAERRSGDVNSAYVNNVYRNMISLYRFNVDMGKLPTGAIILIAGLGAVDVAIVSYLVVKTIKKRKKS